MNDKSCISKTKAFFARKSEAFKQTRLFEWIKKYIVSPLVRFYEHKFLLCLITAAVLNFGIEIASRRSFSRLMLHVVDNFHMFLFGTSVIALTLCISMLFKRRLFVYGVITITWIALGISNVSMLLNRSNPLMLVDLLILRSGLSLSTMYMPTWTIVLLVFGVFLCIVFLIWLFKKCPKEQVRYKRAIAFTLCIAVLVGGLSFIFSIYEVVSPNQRLPDDYDNCGFVYCFLHGIVDTGISEPDLYDTEAIEDLKEVINSVEEKVPEKLPNIIVLQLESFMDMYRIAGAEYSENPHPYFSSLKEEYPHGLLTVNALGACTANVEYEVLTSTDIRSYGFDEYPYLSYLQNSPMESAPYVLKELGYTTTAIHNHNGGFYGRNEAYTNLGFDRFIPLEAFGELKDEDYTYSKYWANDSLILEQIQGTMEKSDGADMIMAVTVQCHSKYHTEYLEDFDYPLTVGGFEDDEVYTNMLLYYSAMAREEDEFVESVLNYLEGLDEESIVIMYGDHLPTFIESSEQLRDYRDGENENAKYDSEYVLWYTSGLTADVSVTEEKKMHSYELLPYALDSVGIRTGNIMRLYYTDLSTEEINEYRDILTYDILEGDNAFFGGKNPYETVETEIGLTPLAVSGYTIEDETLYIEGEGFTPSTQVFVNNSQYSSVYVSPNRMKLTEELTVENGDVISTKLVTTDLKVLSVSEPYQVGDLPQSVVTNKGEAGFHSAVIWGVIFAVAAVFICVCTIVYVKIRKGKKAKNENLI